MDVNKFYDFFQPEKCADRVHIIGCGAVGSTIAELLVRVGITKFSLYDEDIVDSHNIANQMFRHKDIGRLKTEALSEIMSEINPDVDITVNGNYESQMLNGYVFLAVDSIEVRKKIVNGNLYNASIKSVFDTRIRLTDAQAYSANWLIQTDKNNLLNSMNFTDEEAAAETPVSACNITLSVAPTVREICNCVVSNFINTIKDSSKMKKVIVIDAFDFSLNAF